MKTRMTVWTAAGLAAALGAAGPWGCAGGAGRRDEHTIVDDSAVRRDEARRFAAQAQSAGRNDRAIELYQRSLAQSRELGFVQNNLGLLLMERGNYVEAVPLFLEAADVMPESPKPLYNIGLTYSRCGWDEKAMGFYEKALARSPDNRETLRAAVLAGHRAILSDEAALARVRRALMLETDPQWLRLEQGEMYRIEAAQATAKNSTPLEIQAGMTPPPDKGSTAPTGGAPETPPLPQPQPAPMPSPPRQ